VIKFDTDLDGSFADETALTTAQYELWPRNAARGPEPQPWDQLVIPTYSTFSYLFTRGMPVSVTAIFGWPSVPISIRRACIELTRILRLESPRATSTFNAEMGTLVGTNARARNIIDDLKDAYAKVVFA